MKPETQEVPVSEDVVSIYERLKSRRQEYLDRARANALVTIPHLMVPEGHTEGSKLHTPLQSIGSQAVNTLTAKLLMTLLPANAPMFRFSLSDAVVEDLANDKTARAKVDEKLNEIERSAMDEIEGLGIRAAVNEGLRQLIVCGNVLLYLPAKGGLKIYKLDRYVVQRDFSGNVLRIIIKETVSTETLPTDVQELIQAKVELPSDHQEQEASKKEVDIYTVFERKDGMVHTYQWVRGIKLPGSMGRWPIDKSPVMALRWNSVPGEDYGRGHVDEYIGDLEGVENMSRNIREGIAAMTKINPMVNPTGLTRAKDVAEAENLEVLAGRADDVTMLQMEKHADLKFAADFLGTITERLQVAFMMNRSAQRQAERVTAEEIRSVISDIDDTLGGVYSLLAVELQKPLALRILHRMERDKKIPKISALKGADGKTLATPKVVTGIEALGRGQDYNKYRTFMTEIVAPMKEAALAELNIPDLLKRAATALSIDADGLLKSEEDKQRLMGEMQGAQQQQMMTQMMQDVVKGSTPHVAKVAAEGIGQQVMNGEADVPSDL